MHATLGFQLLLKWSVALRGADLKVCGPTHAVNMSLPRFARPQSDLRRRVYGGEGVWW